MELYSWQDISKEAVSPLVMRQVIHTPSMTILRTTFKQGAVIPLHHHIHEQVTMPTEGALRIELEGGEVILRAGEVLRISSNVPHLAEALEDSVSIDLFTPSRDDLRK
jgi:quercetin dioxygenase-like cupin family protein